MNEEHVFARFGAVLRKYRKTKGLSQEELALNSGFDRTFISRMERGLTQPSLFSMLVLAETLGVSASEMVGEVEEAISG